MSSATSLDSLKIHLPFVKSGISMGRFWNTVDNESRALAESYTERRGFFQFMREIGLIGFFDKAYAVVAEEFVHLWEKENHLNIDWDN